MGDLTDFSIGKCQQFNFVPREILYIQIMHADSRHWICVGIIPVENCLTKCVLFLIAYFRDKYIEM